MVKDRLHGMPEFIASSTAFVKEEVYIVHRKRLLRAKVRKKIQLCQWIDRLVDNDTRLKFMILEMFVRKRAVH